MIEAVVWFAIGAVTSYLVIVKPQWMYTLVERVKGFASRK